MKHAPLLALTLLIASTAPAALVSQGGTFGADTETLDTGTGLAWLDLSVTASISFDTMQTQLGTTFAGWRYATGAERQTFFVNAGIPSVPGVSAANVTPITNLIALLGGPLSSVAVPGFQRDAVSAFLGTLGGIGAETGGYLAVGDDPQNLVGTAMPGLDGSALTNTTFSHLGHWLVQDQSSVPEPSTVALVALGLVGVALRRRA